MKISPTYHKIHWKEAKVLQTEPNTTYSEYMEFSHMCLIAHRISQLSSDISPIWTLSIAAEVRKLHIRLV
jgi:hypothetical protein